MVDEQVFWSRVKKAAEDECWPWLGYTTLPDLYRAIRSERPVLFYVLTKKDHAALAQEASRDR